MKLTLDQQLEYIGVLKDSCGNVVITLEECLAKLNIAGLARVTQRCWNNMYFGAVPYVRELRECNKITDKHVIGDFSSVVNGFLANAATWRGPIAKAVKAELNKRLKAKG